MTEVQTEVQKLTNNKEIIAYLAEKFPLCFFLEGEAKPLKIGIFQDLSEALKDDERVTKTQLRYALRQYTSNWRYLHACQVGAQRVDLQGNPAGVLEQEHADHAAQQLAEAKARVAAQRQAERAAREAERAAKGERSKKRPARKNPAQGAKKDANDKANGERKRPALKSVTIEALSKGAAVRVKVGERTQRATVLETSKDAARVQLENGLVMTVSADRLFA